MKITDAMGTVTTFTRDIYGKMTRMVQSGTQNGYTASVTRSFWYDSKQRLCRHRAPELGDEIFIYDNMNNITGKASGLGAGTGCTTALPTSGTRYSYDSLNRNTLINFPGSTADVSFTYDANNNVTAINRGGVNWSYGYDIRDLNVRGVLRMDGRTYTYDRGYDGSGYESARILNGQRFDFTVAGFGRKIAARHGSTTYISGVTYHANGMVKSANLRNGHVITQGINARQLLTSLKSVKGSTKAIDYTYEHDVRSLITKVNDYAVGGNSRSYGYDTNGRLITANGPWGAGSYKYDALANLRQKRLGNRTVTVTYANNKVASVAVAINTSVTTRGYSHDSRGNVIHDGLRAFTYDWANQPTSIRKGGHTSSYVYDGNFKRVKSVSQGKTAYSIFAGDTLMYRHAVTEGKLQSYLDIGPARVRLDNLVPTYEHVDHQGSVVAATNASGTVLWRESYTPFGEKRSDPAANKNRRGYTGHLQDDATDLTYMQARTYDPVIGHLTWPSMLVCRPHRFAA